MKTFITILSLVLVSSIGFAQTASSQLTSMDQQSLQNYENCIAAIGVAGGKTKTFDGVWYYLNLEQSSDPLSTRISKSLIQQSVETSQEAVGKMIIDLVRGNYFATGEGDYTISREEAAYILPALNVCRALGGDIEKIVKNLVRHFPENVVQ